ncbi:MAG: hypothetical protein RBS77_00950 [Candidatus Moranbacteria bacterium]|jgi:hypothetical protein|nr:hypothetical protein [Candidatus Moranbacteria bacterium]
MSKKRKNKKSRKNRIFFNNEISSRADAMVEKSESRDRLVRKNNKKAKNLKIFLAKIHKSMNVRWEDFINKAEKTFSKSILNLKKVNNIFCAGMTCRANIKRDIIITGVAILVAAIFLGMGQYVAAIKSKIQDKKEALAVEEIIQEDLELKNSNEIKTIQEQISTENWKEYKSDWYGFKINYPQDWKTPIVQPKSKSSQAVYRVSFVSDKSDDKNVVGFDVAVYDVTSVKEIFKTDEFPKLKNGTSEDVESCENIEGHLLETGDYPAEEIYIPLADDCYDAVLFFSVLNGQYIYNITPKLKVGAVINNDPMVELSDNLPEFFEAVSLFENIDIVRPKPKPVQPRITAPKPASYKIVNGRMVCAKKNDKPGKSDKGKGKHLDMECCLDPDEYPNPHCYYDPAKYGKYLK